MDWKAFTFMVKVTEGSFFRGTSYDAIGLVLLDLEFFGVCRGEVREPGGAGIGENWANEGVVGEEEGFFLVAPGGASQTFKDSNAGGNLRGDIIGMFGEVEKGIKSNTKDGRGFR